MEEAAYAIAIRCDATGGNGMPPVDLSPADKANITTGDLIESINNVATRDMPLAYAEQLLRGDTNSTVELTVLRLRNPDPQKLTLTRAIVAFPAIVAKMMPDDVGYLHVTSLGGNRVDEIKGKLADLKKQGFTVG